MNAIVYVIECVTPLSPIHGCGTRRPNGSAFWRAAMWEFKAYEVSIEISADLARDLFRQQQTLDYERDWLCGKPVGGAR